MSIKTVWCRFTRSYCTFDARNGTLPSKASMQRHASRNGYAGTRAVF